MCDVYGVYKEFTSLLQKFKMIDSAKLKETFEALTASGIEFEENFKILYPDALKGVVFGL